MLDEIIDEETAANASSSRHDFEIELRQAKRERELSEQRAALGLDEEENGSPAVPARPADASGLRLA